MARALPSRSSIRFLAVPLAAALLLPSVTGAMVHAPEAQSKASPVEMAVVAPLPVPFLHIPPQGPSWMGPRTFDNCANPQALGYAGSPEGSSTGYHSYAVTAESMIQAMDACIGADSGGIHDTSCYSRVTNQFVGGVGRAPPVPLTRGTVQQTLWCAPVGGDGEFEFGLGAAWLNVREGPGAGYQGDGTDWCFVPRSTAHHADDTTVFVTDAASGGNVGILLVADWARGASQSLSGQDENSAPGIAHCGDTIIEPCTVDVHDGFLRDFQNNGIGALGSFVSQFRVPTSTDDLQKDLDLAFGCNPLDTAAYQPPAGPGTRVNALDFAAPLAFFGGGGASGQLIVIVEPGVNANPCYPLSTSVPTAGWIWTGSGADDLGPLASVVVCDGTQIDENHDRYGDEWFGPYEEYASELLDKLQDPESNFQGDGLTNINEFRWLTVPIGPFPAPPLSPIVFLNARDYDYDNWIDGAEVAYWNDPNNDPTLDNPAAALAGLAIIDPDHFQDSDGDDLNTTHDPDSDNDGLLDGDEYNNWSSYPEFGDSDCAAPNAVCRTPAQAGTTWEARSDPNKPGSGDGINDWAELAKWKAIHSTAVLTDYDRDGTQSNLLDPDSDGDEVPDGTEFTCPRSINGICTQAEKWDTDHDGLLDGADLVIPTSDPRYGIFLANGIVHDDGTGATRFYGETTATTNPAGPDTDGDGLPDGWEVYYHLNPTIADGWTDTDADGLYNVEEYSFRCNASPCPVSPVHWSRLDPTNPDTDGDGLLDGQEGPREADPIEPDTDLDGLRDGEEVFAHDTLPGDADSDGDGLGDYQEVITYRLQRPHPRNPNTDGSHNGTNDDTLTDYQEIVQYYTNVTSWDTDNDGVADGRDARPHDFDAEPTRVDLRSAPDAVQPRQEAYVVFREEGYVDVMMQDAHGAEGDIQSVDVRVRLNGTVNGATDFVNVRQEAQRLDDGTLWGARIGLPSGMSQATSEQFILTVVGSSGNVVSYTGGATETMNSVAWRDDPDPVNSGDWSHLRVHDSPGNTPSDSANPNMDGPSTLGIIGSAMLVEGTNLSVTLAQPAPWNMSVEELFAAYGRFSIYRLKPFALPAEALPHVPDPTDYATHRTVSVLENEGGWNITIWEDAFELVDPSQEPGAYASMASGGNSYFRTARALRVGLHQTWDIGRHWGGIVSEEAVAQGASFLFGSDDPRAKGRLSGDIVAGILVYGDVRDVVVGTIKEDEIKVALGGIGIGLTWVGPQADGPYSAFKAGIKVIVNAGPAGKRVAVLILNSMREQLAAKAAANDAAGALSVLVASVKETSWLQRNVAKIPDYERARAVLPQEAIHGLDGKFDNLADFSRSAATTFGDQAAREMLPRLYRTTQLGGPEETLEKVIALHKVATDTIGTGRGVVPGDPENMAKALTKFADTPGVATWYGRVIQNVDSGAVYEARKYEERYDLGQLAEISDEMTFVWKGTETVETETDMWIRESGGLLWTELKKGKLDDVKQVEKNLKGVTHVVENVPSKGALRQLNYEIGDVVDPRITDDLHRLAREYQVPIYVRDGAGQVTVYPTG